MGAPRFTPEFKEEAVKQVTERGYSVSEVSALKPACRNLGKRIKLTWARHVCTTAR
jgi:transposase-like protein